MAQLNDLLVLGKAVIKDSIKANSDNDLLAHGNEFNFASPSFNGDIYINYRTASGSNGSIKKYLFCQGAGSSFADLKAANYEGTNLVIVNDASNTTYDTLAYFRTYSSADWGVIIDKNAGYDHGLRINTAHSGTYALQVNGGSRFSNTLRIGSAATTFEGNWCEGIRIGAADGQWVTIALGVTAETGTNANCWSIHRTNTGAFSISKNSSDGANGLFMNATGMALGHTSPSHRLHVVGDIKTEGTLYLERNKGGKAGRINFYKDTYNNWVEYMSDRTAGTCPTGGTPSSLGNVTAWARRSIIENVSGYGWVWEAASTTTTAAASSTIPTARMALSSSDGTLTVTGPIKSGSLPGTWVSGCNGNALVNSTMSPGAFSPMLSGGTTNGRMVLAFYTNGLQATYITKANCDSGTNTVGATAILMNESGGAKWPGLLTQGNPSSDSTIANMNRFTADLYVQGNGSAPNSPKVAGFYLGKSTSDENRHMDIVSGGDYAYIDFNKASVVEDYKARILVNVTSGYTEFNWGSSATSAQFHVNGILSGNRIYTGYDSGVANSVSCSNWFRSNGTSGWYNASYGNHLQPNTTTLYGGFMMYGNVRNGYEGIILGSSNVHMTLMSSDPHQGLYNEATGKWIIYYNKTNQYVSLGGAQTTASGYPITLYGKTEITDSLKVTGVGYFTGGRVHGSGDDEGIILGTASNGYAGFILGSHNARRSIFYMNSTKAMWRYNNGSASYDIDHPCKSGTIALTSDLQSMGGQGTFKAYLDSLKE